MNIQQHSETHTHTIVPAEPGWFTALLVEFEDYLFLQPIVAWEITRTNGSFRRTDDPSLLHRYVHHTAEPITLEGNMNDINNAWCFKRPDGKFEIRNYNTYDDEPAAIEALKSINKEKERKLKQVK